MRSPGHSPCVNRLRNRNTPYRSVAETVARSGPMPNSGKRAARQCSRSSHRAGVIPARPTRALAHRARRGAACRRQRAGCATGRDGLLVSSAGRRLVVARAGRNNRQSAEQPVIAVSLLLQCACRACMRNRWGKHRSLRPLVPCSRINSDCTSRKQVNVPAAGTSCPMERREAWLPSGKNSRFKLLSCQVPSGYRRA